MGQTLAKIVTEALSSKMKHIDTLTVGDVFKLHIIPGSLQSSIKTPRSTNYFSAQVSWSFSLSFEGKVFYTSPRDALSTLVKYNFNLDKLDTLILDLSKQFFLNHEVSYEPVAIPNTHELNQMLELLITLYKEHPRFDSPEYRNLFIRSILKCINANCLDGSIVSKELLDQLWFTSVYEDSEGYVFTDFNNDCPLVIRKMRKGLVKVDKGTLFIERQKLATKLIGHLN